MGREDDDWNYALTRLWAASNLYGPDYKDQPEIVKLLLAVWDILEFLDNPD